MLALVLSPLVAQLGLPTQAADWLGSFNPYVSMNRLVWDNETAPALATSVVWLVMGFLGTAVAAWRLRPTCLATGEVVKKSRRRAWVRRLVTGRCSGKSFTSSAWGHSEGLAGG